MNITSIDFSLNSTGICIYDKENNDIKLYSIVNTNSFLGKKENVLSNFKIHKELEDLNYVTFIKNIRNSQNEDYTLDQKNKLSDAINIANLILNIIPKDSLIVMEGFSYSSNSRSFIDLILFASIVRAKLYENFNNITIYAPSEIKRNLTGKGTANKPDMINGILKCNELFIINSNFISYCRENKETLIDKKDVKKPVEDLIDSISILKCFLDKHS